VTGTGAARTTPSPAAPDATPPGATTTPGAAVPSPATPLRATGIVPPRYGTGSIIDIVPSVLSALGATGLGDPLGLAAGHPGLKRAVVLLIDGLGYHQLDTVAEVSPTIADFRSGRFGTVDRLTTGFPSTTPVSLANLTTGVPPGEHGILGFTLRIPGTDRVLNHIRWADDPPPERWQPARTLLSAGRDAGITTRVVSRPEFAGSGLTTAVYRGADYIGGSGVEALADAIIDALVEPEGPTFVYGYHPDLDHAGHLFGVESEAWLDEARKVERLLARLAARLPSDAALFVTADHGQLTVPEDMRFDLDRDPRLRDGVALVAGEPRVRYLHVAPGAAEDVRATWEGVLGEAATILTRSEAVATGWYGPVRPEHLDRIGDLVVVCRDRFAVVRSRAEPTETALIGFHGGLTEIEMEIPLLALRW
jgi:hypothetical protein